MAVLVLVTQSCLILCGPTDCSPGSLSMGFSREEYWSGLPYPLQWIFSTQGSNPGLLHRRQILNRLSHPRSPGGGAISLQNMLNVTCLALFQEPIVPEEPSPKDSLTWEPMSRAPLGPDHLQSHNKPSASSSSLISSCGQRSR